MHEVLVNRLGGLSLPRKSVVRLTDRPDMTLDVYRGRKTTIQQQPLVVKIIKKSGLQLLQLHTLLIFLQMQNQIHVYVGGGRDNIVENNIMYKSTSYSIQVNGQGLHHNSDKDLNNHLKVFSRFTDCIYSVNSLN